MLLWNHPAHNLQLSKLETGWSHRLDVTSADGGSLHCLLLCSKNQLLSNLINGVCIRPKHVLLSPMVPCCLLTVPRFGFVSRSFQCLVLDTMLVQRLRCRL